MDSTLLKCLSLFKTSQPFGLATVISRNGSAPRGTGARMVVMEDLQIYGTVGGGVLEARVIQEFQHIVFPSKHDHLAVFDFSGEDAAQSLEMICGGTVRVLLEYVAPDDSDLNAALRAMLQMTDQETGWFLTQLPRGARAARHAFFSSSHPEASPVWAPAEFAWGAETSARVIDDCYLEPIAPAAVVYIFGAGHVGQALARLTAPVGFKTVILDDREDFANQRRFPDADEIILLKDPTAPFEQLHIHRNAFIVIVTRGHLHDKHVLAGALKTPARYIGMIGSKRKRELVYQELEAEGFSRAALNQVHSPIGLPILAETPEEIAVSILAELIRARAEKIV